MAWLAFGPIFSFLTILIFSTISSSSLSPLFPSISHAIDHGLSIIGYLVNHEDPRLAYIYIKSILAHPNASFSQRYTAIQLLASASNCSRHINIEKRSLVDILRSDHEMEYQVNLLLFPENIEDYRAMSFDNYVGRYFHQNRLEDVLTLSNTYASQYETLSTLELPSLLQSYGIYFGRNAEFDRSKSYFEFCVNAADRLGYESHPCSHMLQHSNRQINYGLSAVIEELSHRVLASRSISAARNNYDVVTKILEILRNLPNPKPSQAVMQSAITTLFECKKYLYYHGWLTQIEFIQTMKSVMSQSHLASDVYMIDTQKLAFQDMNFADWRHNGSEYQYWLLRKPSSVQNTINRPYILRFITNGMSAHNFGHANHDILWPFITSYNLYNLFPRVDAPIYVIDIGIFLLKFLRIAFPRRTFIGFRSMSMVPIDAEEILISGLGAPKYFDVNTIRREEMKEVRSHMLQRCSDELGIDAPHENPNDTLRIVFIERNLTMKFKVENDLRYQLDYEEDHPALRHYYDSGYWSHTVLTSKRVLGSQRRNILNFDVMYDEFQPIFTSLYHQHSTSSSSLLHRKKIEFFRFNPEEYEYCEQVLAISKANVVIGQHGAAMSLIGYMKPGEGIVIELESILNQIFQFISEGTGLKYRGVLMNEYEGVIYQTKDKHHIKVNPSGLAHLLVEMLRS